MASAAMKLLLKAEAKLKGLEEKPTVRDEAMTKVLDAKSKVFAARGDIGSALDQVRQRLRYESTPDALRLEAELLDLHAEQGRRINKETRIRLAADHAWESVRANGKRRKRRQRTS